MKLPRTNLYRFYLIFPALICALAPLKAKAFHGPFAGVQVGYAMNKLKLSHKTSTIEGNKSPDMSNWILGAHGGYGRTFDNNFYLGAEMFITFDGVGDATKDYTLVNGATRRAASSKLSRSFSFGLDMRLGVKFEAAGTEMLVYAGPTLQWSRWSSRGSLHGDGTQVSTKKSMVMAYGPHLGYEFRIKRDLTAGIIGKYILFNKPEFTNLKVDPKSYQIALYVNLHM